MENNFFRYLAKNNMMVEWAPILDWYLSNNHFEGDRWRNYISVFTKRIKRIKLLQDVSIKYGGKGKLSFPAKQARTTKIILEKSNNEGDGKCLVRHIRNGIAHGRSKFVTIKKQSFIEIKDYRDDKQVHQSAYILVPRECLIKIYDVYLSLKKNYKI